MNSPASLLPVIQPRELRAVLQGGSSRPLHVRCADERDWFMRCSGAADYAADTLAELLAWRLARAMAPLLDVRVATPVWFDLAALTLPERLDGELADTLTRSNAGGSGRAWIDGTPAAPLPPGTAPGAGLFLLDLILLNPDRRRRDAQLISATDSAFDGAINPVWAIDFGAAWISRQASPPALQADHPLWPCLRDHARLPQLAALRAALAALEVNAAAVVDEVNQAAGGRLEVPGDLPERLAARLDRQRLQAEIELIYALPEPDPAAERAAQQRRQAEATRRLNLLQRRR